MADAVSPSMVLSGVRVLELGSSVAASFCGKVFADFGAEVVKVEAPGGDPLRRRLTPLLTAAGGGTHSGTFAWLNTNKRSVIGDLAVAEDTARAVSLAAGCDVVIDGRTPVERDASEARADTLRNTGGNLVYVAISDFGESGPYRDFRGTESICRALSGALAGVGPIEGPPLIANDTQAGVITGISAFIAAAAGLYGRCQGARVFSTSMQEVLVHMIAMDIATTRANGKPRRRYGVNRFGQTHPASIYETKQGWIGTTTQTPDQWRSTCELLGCPELASDPRFGTGAARAQAADELDAILNPLFKTRTAETWFELARKRRLAYAIVPSMEELLKQQAHRERGAFGPVRIDGLAFEGPVMPHRLMKTPPIAGGNAPLPGQHDRDYPAVSQATPAPKRPAASERPLSGVRIVDITMGWAGPMATRFLGDLGAEIIKIEAVTYPDWWRGFERNERWFREKFYEKTPGYNSMNIYKRGVTLDLTTPEGRDLFKRLVADAHGVIDNYAADVLPRLGLDYETLSQINPSLVMVSMPPFASKGTWSDCRGYGTTLEQASGLPNISGEEGGPPAMSQYAHADPYGGYNATAAMLLGLLHRQRTGEGQFVEMAHVGGMLALAAPGIIEQSATGRVGPRLGNRHAMFVPHGAFPAEGQDKWVVVAVTTNEEWRALCGVIGRPDLAGVTDRRAREAEVEAAVTEWTRARSPEDAMRQLQAAGVPAGAVLNSLEVLSDANLAARGFWQTLPREYVGTVTVASAPFREDDQAYVVTTPAPTVGQHNAEVLVGELGLTAAQMADLEARRVIGHELIEPAPAA